MSVSRNSNDTTNTSQNPSDTNQSSNLNDLSIADELNKIAETPIENGEINAEVAENEEAEEMEPENPLDGNWKTQLVYYNRFF